MLPADLPRFPRRGRDTSKRDYGRVLIVGGSSGMAGAPALSAIASLRSGAGIVELLVPEQVGSIAAGFHPCVMTYGLPGRADGTFASDAIGQILERARRADAIAVGPGIGRSESVQSLVQQLWAELPQPAVFDADALWALSQTSREQLARHAGPRVLTPHAGEMQQFLGPGPVCERSLLEQAAAAFALTTATVIVLKGPDTFVVDRTRRAHNHTGNPGMATAGAGDVLTGVIAALLGQHCGHDHEEQGLDPFNAARLAAWVHGHAGDIAEETRGEISLIASDILDSLSAAFSSLAAQSER
ncbi:MAG: NAD(P)H-hydrate dehydratase [Planctomycetota bacterium]